MIPERRHGGDDRGVAGNHEGSEEPAMFRLRYYGKHRDVRYVDPGTCGGCRAVTATKACRFERVACFFNYMDKRTIETALCRSCARHYFLSFTVDTIKLGFFGLRFLFSVLAILNNMFMFLRFLGGRKPRVG